MLETFDCESGLLVVLETFYETFECSLWKLEAWKHLTAFCKLLSEKMAVEIFDTHYVTIVLHNLNNWTRKAIRYFTSITSGKNLVMKMRVMNEKSLRSAEIEQQNLIRTAKNMLYYTCIIHSLVRNSNISFVNNITFKIRWSVICVSCILLSRRFQRNTKN